jgi:exodeoxyribonuclease VIII
MIDLETLGTSNNALIWGLGAVVFNPDGHYPDILAGDYLGERFYVNIDIKSSLEYKGVIDADTLTWWLDPQRNAAREQLLVNPIDVGSALETFSMWLDHQAHRIEQPYNIVMWGNGATFDNVILRRAYERLGLEVPWKFYNDRCYRTIKSLAPDIKLERVGTYHNAVDDAVSQAEHLVRIVKSLNIQI